MRENVFDVFTLCCSNEGLICGIGFICKKNRRSFLIPDRVLIPGACLTKIGGSFVIMSLNGITTLIYPVCTLFGFLGKIKSFRGYLSLRLRAAYLSPVSFPANQ